MHMQMSRSAACTCRTVGVRYADANPVEVMLCAHADKWGCLEQLSGVTCISTTAWSSILRGSSRALAAAGACATVRHGPACHCTSAKPLCRESVAAMCAAPSLQCILCSFCECQGSRPFKGLVWSRGKLQRSRQPKTFQDIGVQVIQLW